LRFAEQFEIGLEAGRVRKADLAQRTQAKARRHAGQPAHRLRRLVGMTETGAPQGKDAIRTGCTARPHIRRVDLECIELYQLHAVDRRIPIEDSIGALVDLQREGKIRHIGVSNVSERELARARRVASIVSVQNHYNLRDRSSDRLIDICAEAGMAFIPWYPLAAGRLASPSSLLARIAQSHGTTPSQISLAWLLQRSPAMLPIPGTSSIAHLEENLAAALIRLTSDELRTIASL
jgi:aryl-alcohol dehydrogenase-like predicted oxidoreductase